MDEAVLLPAEGVAEHETKPSIVPWLERQRIGRVRAWLRTAGWGFSTPTRLGRDLPTPSPEIQGFLYGWLTALLGWGLNLFVPLILFGLGSALAASPIPLSGVIVACAAHAAVSAVAILFVGAVMHATLRVTGPVDGGIGRTIETVGYATGPLLVSAIPCCGTYTLPVGWIWWTIAAGLALQVRQRVSGLRIGLAIAAPSLVVALVFGSLIALAVWSSGASVGATPTFQQNLQTRSMALRVAQAGMQSPNGQVSKHPAAWLGRQPTGAPPGAAPVDPYLPILAGTNTTPSLIPLGQTTLDRFLGYPIDSAQHASVINMANAHLPAGVVAYRFGDFVFTHPGIDFRTADPGLWVVVASPAPDIGASNTPPDPILVGLADGSMRTIPTAAWTAALAGQNAVRAGQGLPSLSDPLAITHAAPAVSQP